MKRLRIVYQDSAIDDLKDISLFLLQRGASAPITRAYIGRIREACRRIGDVPESGRLRPDLATGLRTSAFERRVLIAYRVEREAVVIEHVFYGGQDVDGRYSGRLRRQSDEP